ncbi:MAG: hypothetical protein ABIP49_07095 [Lysobacterales bacterium]
MIVPERNGVGLKLKMHNSFFNRLPIFALAVSFAEMPPVNNDSVLFFRDHAALLRRVLESMDDVDRRDRLRERASSTCRDPLDRVSRGQHIVDSAVIEP